MCFRSGRVHELNWINWTERTERTHFAPVPWPELNELAADSTRQVSWTERTLLKQFWAEFASLRHNTTSWTSKQARTASKAHHPSTQATIPAGRRAGISAGWDVELLPCSPRGLSLPGRFDDWTEPQPKRASQVNPSQGWKSLWNELNKLNWTEALGLVPPTELNELFQTNWWLGNWTVLIWCQSILNFERGDIVSSRTLPDLMCLSDQDASLDICHAIPGSKDDLDMRSNPRLTF